MRKGGAKSLVLPALAGLLMASAAFGGDVSGRVEVTPRRYDPAPRAPTLVFLRGNGMVTTRRGGPLVQVMVLESTGSHLSARLGDTLSVTPPDGSDYVFFFSGAVTRALPRDPRTHRFTKILDQFGPFEIYASGVSAPGAWGIVLENPYVKEADPDGSFLLDGVTPGPYNLCAWRSGRPVSCVPVEIPFEGRVRARIVLR